MALDLPKDPREREIILRALREYSEACEPPALMPDCPFSIEIELGIRGCGEECMDMLGRYSAPRPREEVELGNGIRVYTRRPRPRRARQTLTKPYDAREIYLDDKASGPPARWRLASLLTGIIEAVETPPPVDADKAIGRMEHINNLISLIEGRGLNFETQVLPVLRHLIAPAVFAHLQAPNRDHTSSRSSGHARSWASWINSHLGTAAPDQSSDAQDDRRRSVFLSISQWAHTADDQALLGWLPPSEAQESRPPRSQDSDGIWIVERFTTTYLDKWSTSSLRKEWMYLHGEHPPPCSPLEMSAREVPEDDLAKELADRLAKQPSASQPPHRPPLAHMLVMPAVRFLNENRRVEAAALFEAAAHHNPDDPHALNNLGFCLLPDNPDRALEYLEKAIKTGRGDKPLIDTNRILALAALGRRTSAIDLAGQMQRQAASHEHRSITWLWQIDSILYGREPRLVERGDLPTYAAEIVAKIDNGTNRGPD